MARKVIIVAPKVVSEFLSDEYSTHWDIQRPCESIELMWDRLYTEEISVESEIVFIVDALFKDNPDAFVEAVAMLAPEALVMVLAYENNDKVIRTRVTEYAKEHSIPVAPFHFIRAATALPQIEETIAKHGRKDDGKVVLNKIAEAPKKVYAARKSGANELTSSTDEQSSEASTVEVAGSTDN